MCTVKLVYVWYNCLICIFLIVAILRPLFLLNCKLYSSPNLIYILIYLKSSQLRMSSCNRKIDKIRNLYRHFLL